MADSLNENPYQSPETYASVVDEYYGCDTRKLSIAECRRFAPSLFGFLTLLFLKCCRVSLPVIVGFRRHSQVMLVDDQQAASRINEVAKATVAEAAEKGFVDLYWHADDAIGNFHAIAGEMRGPDGETQFGVSYVKSTGAQATEENMFFFMSRFPEGDWFITTDTWKRLDGPRAFQAEYMPGSSMTQVLARHRERLRLSGREPEQVLTRHRMGELTLERIETSFDFNLKRGYYRRLSQAEVDRLRDPSSQSATAEKSLPPWAVKAQMFGCGINMLGMIVVAVGYFQGNYPLLATGAAICIFMAVVTFVINRFKQ